MRRTTLSTAVTLTLASSLLSGFGVIPAGLTPSTPRHSTPTGGAIVEVLLGDDVQFDERAYGGDTDQQIPLGDDTSAIVIELDFASFGPTVTCEVENQYSPVTKTWTATEWADDQQKALRFPAGSLEPDPFSYPFILVACSSFPTSASSGGGWRVEWTTTPVPSAGPTITLVESERLLTRELIAHHYNSGAISIHPGDRLTIVGAPGAWLRPSPDLMSNTYARLGVLVDGELVTTVPSTYGISDDRSRFSIVIPTDFTREYTGTDEVQVLALSSTQKTGTEQNPQSNEDVWWEGTLELDPKQSSSTAVTLARPLALSFERVRMTVTVKSPDVPSPTGTVSISVDGRPVTSTTLEANSRGVATLRLPELRRGIHRVTASFTGSDRIERSVSAGAPLFVLF